jgi:hypothetical protein
MTIKPLCCQTRGCRDIQHNGTQYNDTQHCDIQQKNKICLSVLAMTMTRKNATLSINNSQHNKKI